MKELTCRILAAGLCFCPACPHWWITSTGMLWPAYGLNEPTRRNKFLVQSGMAGMNTASGLLTAACPLNWLLEYVTALSMAHTRKMTSTDWTAWKRFRRQLRSLLRAAGRKASLGMPGRPGHHHSLNTVTLVKAPDVACTQQPAHEPDHNILFQKGIALAQERHWQREPHRADCIRKGRWKGPEDKILEFIVPASIGSTEATEATERFSYFLSELGYCTLQNGQVNPGVSWLVTCSLT